MKFLSIHTYHDSYLYQFYRRHNELAAAPYSVQLAALLKDGFGASQMYAPSLNRLGYHAEPIIANCPYAQRKWLEENGQAPGNGERWMLETVRLQIESFHPDVILMCDPVPFDSDFLDSLSWKPSLVAGWQGAPTGPATDWSRYDLLLSDSQTVLESARAHGVKAAEFFSCGLPSWIGTTLQGEPKRYDLMYAGAWSPGQGGRNALIQEISRAASTGTGFDPVFFLEGAPKQMAPEVLQRTRGELWGLDMYRALRQAKIVFDAPAGPADDRSANARMLEATGVGSFLLTEHNDSIGNYFEPGREVGTYRTQGELLEKIGYYLAHPEEREEIAARGQQRFLREHAMERRLEDLDALMRRHVAGAGGTGSPKEPEVDLYDQAYRWGWEHPDLRQTVYLCYKTPDFADNARRFHDSDEFRAAVALLGSLGHGPAASQRVLDIGCGNGVASYALARCGYQVTGIDSSTGELAGIRAAEKLQGLDGVRLTIRHAASQHLEFPDESFDIVWMREVLHHITDLVPFLNEVKRVLRPGGVLCCMRDVVIWNESQRTSFFANHPFYHITHDEGCYYLREYREAFQAAGLVTEKELDPLASVINTFPSVSPPGAVYDPAESMASPTGYDLFTFFLRKPALSPGQARSAVELAERFDRLQSNKQTMRPGSGLESAAPAPSASADPFDPADLAGCFPGVSFGEMIQVLGMRNISIGQGTCIGDSSWLNVCIRDEQTRMRIGACVLVGRQAVISTAGFLEIGDYCLFAPRVYISDADHIYTDIFQPIVQQGATCHRSIIVEENCWLGINTVISGSLTLGRGSVVGANAVVTRDIPPFCVVVGNPAQIVKMYAPRSNSWERVRSEEDIQHILDQRRETGMLSREEYRQVLKQNARVDGLDPILAGRGNLI